jgi:hypothetical protein
LVHLIITCVRKVENFMTRDHFGDQITEGRITLVISLV